MLKDKMTALLEELEGIDNRIKGKEEIITKLQEENKFLQKQIDEGFKTFNTETHCLVARDELVELIAELDNVDTYEIERNISEARGYCEEAEYSLDGIGRECRDAIRGIEKILKDTEVVEERTSMEKAADAEDPNYKVTVKKAAVKKS